MVCFAQLTAVELKQRGEHMPANVNAEGQQPGRRVYLDVCALNRPTDDQSQMRIRLEADAVHLILSHVRARTLSLVVSPAHHAEVAANPDLTKRQHVQALIAEIGTSAEVDLDDARKRAVELLGAGLGPADAAHVALAEAADCDFVTVDDRLLRQLRRVGIRVWCGTPAAYCDKEGLR